MEEFGLRLLFKVLEKNGKYLATLMITGGLIVSAKKERDTFKEAVKDFIEVWEQYENLNVLDTKKYMED